MLSCCLYGEHERVVCAVVVTGKIVTIETLPLKLPRKQWKGREINPDQTCYADDYLRHVLYITRIYFRYGSPDPELIGRYFAPCRRREKCDVSMC